MKKQVTFTTNGIQIGNKEVPLYSGSVHYWRMEPKHWETVLSHVKEMGFDIVETYIPWAVHEPERGTYDFGEQDPHKDLERFLSLCEEKKLWVIVRPGPHINAEMTLFGYPKWLLEMPKVQARTPLGTSVVYPYATKQFPIPSYASATLYQETERYFAKLAPILRRHCYPQGGIIAIQADNETCNFFRDNPYIMDYSEESAALFHRMLQEKYGVISVLNETYGTTYEGFSQVPLPSGYQEGDGNLIPYFDWVEYKEYQILDTLRRMTELVEGMELPIPIFHNCAYQTYTPISVQRDEEIPGLSVAGMDAYPEPGDSSMLKERIRYLAGSSRLPFVPEFGSGSWFDRGTLLSPEEERFGYLYAWMNGLKAVNFYMLAERDRWTGCPIGNDGTVREEYYEMFTSLMKLLKEEELCQYQRSPRILILKNYDMGRLRALLSVRNRNLFSSNCFIQGTDIPQELFSPEKLPDCMVDPSPGHYGRERWIEELMETLDGCHQEYDLSDCYLSQKRLEDYDWVFASSYDFMEPQVQKKLADYGQLPGKQLCIGPAVPKKDRRGNSCRILEEALKKGTVQVLEKPRELTGRLSLPAGEYSCEEPGIEFSVHRKPDSKEQLLYLANVTGQKKEAALSYKGKREFLGIWQGECRKQEGLLEAVLKPYEIKIWKVKKGEEPYA